MDLNRQLDRLPRLTVDIGHRRLPVFRCLGVIGYQLAVLVTVMLSLVNDAGPAVALGVSATAGLSFFGWGLLRRAITGHERLVLIEYVWVGFAAVAGYLWIAQAPVRAGLDLMSVAVCMFLAAGRVGCAVVGCCHGQPAETGLRYGRQHGLSARLTDRRLWPVQLLEAAGLLAVGGAGFALATGTPGRATVWFLVAYAVLRFGCEALRGDKRPSLLGVSVPRLTCVVQLTIGLAVSERWLMPGPAGRQLQASLVVVLVAAVSGLALTQRRLAGPLVAPNALDETWELILDLARDGDPDRPSVATTAAGLRVGVTVSDADIHVSLSHPTYPTYPVGLALRPRELVQRASVTHIAVGRPPTLPRPPHQAASTTYEAPPRPTEDSAQELVLARTHRAVAVGQPPAAPYFESRPGLSSHAARPGGGQ